MDRRPRMYLLLVAVVAYTVGYWLGNHYAWKPPKHVGIVWPAGSKVIIHEALITVLEPAKEEPPCYGIAPLRTTADCELSDIWIHNFPDAHFVTLAKGTAHIRNCWMNIEVGPVPTADHE